METSWNAAGFAVLICCSQVQYHIVYITCNISCFNHLSCQERLGIGNVFSFGALLVSRYRLWPWGQEEEERKERKESQKEWQVIRKEEGDKGEEREAFGKGKGQAWEGTGTWREEEAEGIDQQRKKGLFYGRSQYMINGSSPHAGWLTDLWFQSQ